jgi:hypothetical protein
MHEMETSPPCWHGECDISLPLVDMVSVTYLSPLLTHALIKLEPKDYNSPSKHAMNAEMHIWRSFKIIASRLKECSSWCCHVYIATSTSASKCSKWPNEKKYVIWSSLSNLKEGSPPNEHIANIDRRSTLCYTCMQSELPQTKFTHHVMRQTCDLIKFWILSELCSLSQKFVKQMCAGGYRCHQNLTYRSCQAYAKSNQKLKTMISVSITELKFTLKCNKELSRYSDMGQQRPIPIFSYLFF